MLNFIGGMLIGIIIGIIIGGLAMYRGNKK